MLRFKILGSLLLFCFTVGLTQSSECLVVVDSVTLDPVEFANVILYDKTDSTIVQFGITDAAGQYCLRRPLNSQLDCYTSISHLSYRSQILDSKIKDQDTVFLTSQDLFLNEIVVSNRKDVVSKKDTITFNVKEFLDSTESNLEDVLSKLPGITVDRETGNVLVLGRPLESILLENENVTDTNYKLASKNLPAYAVEKIQIIKNYGGNDPLSNGRLTALNVKLTEEAKDRFIGSIHVKFGTRHRHDHSGSAIIVSTKIKSISSLSYNNTGKGAYGSKIEQSSINVSDLERMTEQFSPIPTSFINNSLNTNTLLPTNLLRSNKELLLTNNTILKLNKKSSINVSLIGLSDDNSVSKNTIISLPTNESSYSQTSLANLKSDYLSSRIRYSLRPDNTTEIKFYLTASGDDRLKNSTVNHSSLDSLIDQSEYSETVSSVRLALSKQLSTSLDVKFSSEHSRTKLINDYELNYRRPINLPFADDITRLNQSINQRVDQSVHQALVRAVFERTTLIMGLNFRKRDFSILGKINTFEPVRSYPENEQKITFYTPSYQFHLKYDKDSDEQIDFSGQLFQTVIENNSVTTKYQPAINCKLAYHINLNFLHNLNLSVKVNNQVGNIDGYYSNYYIKSPLSIFRGSELIEMSRVLSASGGYSYENFEGDFLFSLTGDYSNGRSGWINRYNILDSGLVLQELTPGSVPVHSFIASANFERYLEKREVRLRLKPTYSTNIGEYRIGEKITSNSLTSFGLELTARSGSIGGFGFYAGSALKYNRFNIDKDRIDYPSTMRTFLDISYVRKKMQANLINDYFLIGNQFNTAFYSLALRLKWKASALFELTLDVRNLLDEKVYRQVDTGSYLVSSTNYSVLPRFALIGVKFVY
jgi:hypothetical protein